MPREFTMSENEDMEAQEWVKNHNCSKIDMRSISYKFTPVGMGTGVEVSCSCGAKKDVTDVGGW